VTQEVVQAPIKTLGMQLIERQLGRPLEEYLREQYLKRERTQREIAEDLGVDVGSVSRWMERLGIPSRRIGYRKAG
jgi:DNA-binding MarR family transcriptional regulator